MKTVQCAAVDLGATSGRVIVGEWDGRGLVLTEVHRFPNQFHSLAGHEYWDLPVLWSEVRAGLVKARGLFPRLASVGVDGWAVDHVLVDPKGRPVHPVHAYRDSRTASASRRLGRRGIDRVYALTGIPNYSYNTSLQLQETLDACPAMAQAASRCLFIPDYFNFLISGRMVNELSIASHSQLIDVRGSDWSRAALGYFGIPRRWFGSPALSPRRLGTVVGIGELKGVVSVLVPGHDTACAFAAMPASEDGSDLFLSSGTWSLLGIESDVPLLGPGALEARVSNERSGDGRYRPLISCLGLWLLEQVLSGFSSRPTTGTAWKQLIGAASRSPAPTHLLDLGDSTLFNPANMRTAIDAQLRRRKCRAPRDLAGYVRLICASLGKRHAEAVHSLERLAGRRTKRIVIVGGGSQNRLLCQETADACSMPVASYSLEGAAVGNIAAQLIALGEVRDIASFRATFGRKLARADYLPRRMRGAIGL
jgi:rhamnulokinase